MIEMLREIINWFIKKVGKPPMRDNVGLSDSIEIMFIKNGEIIKREKISGHTWISGGLTYVRDCLRSAGAKVPVDSMSAYGSGGESWKDVVVDGYGASPYTVTWHSGWEETNPLTISAFKIAGGGTTYSSIAFTQFIKPNGISLDVYYTSTVSTS